MSYKDKNANENNRNITSTTKPYINYKLESNNSK